MTMRFIPTTSIISSDCTLRYLFAWLDFMRTASPTGPGWTIPRSSDGTTGGAGDNIADFNDLTNWSNGPANVSWFVLQDPAGVKEYLFYRFDASDNNWGILYSPAAGFTGGDEDDYATATDQVAYFGGGLVQPTDCTLHMGADDAAPYGWFAYMHDNGNFATQRAGMAHIPITDSVQPGDIDPYVFAIGAAQTEVFIYQAFTTSAVSGGISKCVGIPPGQAGVRTIPAMYFRDFQTAITIPSFMPTDDNGADLSFPIPFGVAGTLSAPTGFKGFSTFCQWNGAARAAGETFASKTRVSWGDVNFPWDGSVPEVSP